MTVCSSNRPTPIPGFLDDYAFVACGLLDLYEATLRTEWLRWAEELQLRQDVLFWDAQGGGYYCSQPSDPTPLLKLKQGEGGQRGGELLQPVQRPHPAAEAQKRLVGT